MKYKFRVWDGEEYLSLSEALAQDIVGVVNGYDSFELEPYYDHVVLEMFTGLKDKNGVEIYEGDKVKYTIDREMVGIVVWYEDGWCIKEWNSDIPQWINTWNSSYSNRTRNEGKTLLEVTGNIHNQKGMI